jgi:hypothetical protein
MGFEDRVKLLALRFRFSVTSWIRSPVRNVAVGGVADSRHLHGLAVDCVLDEEKDRGEFKKAAAALGLQVIEEGDHIHLQEPRA